MRSRAEWGLRLAALGLLIWALWRALQPAATPAEWADTRSLRAALARWTVASPPPPAVRVVVDDGSALAGYARQWLIALRQTGTSVQWSTTHPLPASAVDAEPVADPRGATWVRVAAPAGATVVVSTALGPLDTVRAAPGGYGATVMVPAPLRTVDADVGGTPSHGAVTDSLTVRRILVLGRAGWESKFIVRALEEEGWIVDLRLRVAPKHDVVQGHESAIDTAHYAAVIAVDTSVRALAGQLAAYVRSGGGLVTLAGYGGGTRADTVVLERQGLGRVAQVGYHDTWRWRMADADSGPARHRAWWSGVVASVSYAPSTTRLVATADADPAPLANLIDALGPPASPMAAVAPRRPPIDPTRQPWVFGAVLATLSLEWASRRLRGRH